MRRLDDLAPAEHELKTDRDSKPYRKGKTASELRCMGHTLTDCHDLVVDAGVRKATALPNAKQPR